MDKTFYTIGYQEKSIDEFIGSILEHKINVVIDIRYNPNSRRKGFSKNKLANQLQSNNIIYTHLKELGTPPDVRKKAIEKNDHLIVINRWKKLIDNKINLLYNLNDEYSDATICFMCYEKDHMYCHRSVVGNTFGELTKHQIIHL